MLETLYAGELRPCPDVLEALGFNLELPAARPGEAVKLCLPIVVRCAPLGLDPPLALQAVERLVEGGILDRQLPMLRALWPGPLVCRWNLHRKHGAYGYEEAKGLYEPFDRLVDPDPESRAELAGLIGEFADGPRSIDIDRQPQVMDQFEVRSIPTMIVLAPARIIE